MLENMHYIQTFNIQTKSQTKLNPFLILWSKLLKHMKICQTKLQKYLEEYETSDYNGPTYHSNNTNMWQI